MLRRVVGYLEYGSALMNLEELVTMATPEDLKAIDSIIDERIEFTIFSPLADRLEMINAPVDAMNAAKTRLSATSERRNLAWLMALARVEFGAIIAGFSDNPEPYAFIRPGSHGYKESMQLLLEGVVGHYEAMPREKEFKEAERAANKKVNLVRSLSQMEHNRGSVTFSGMDYQGLAGDRIKTVLAFSRRVRIARSMLYSLMKPGPSAYSDGVAKGLDSYRRELEPAQTYLNAKIREYLETQVEIETQRSRSSLEVACYSQLQAEKREIAAGTARVTNFQSPGER